ncbi:Mu transposase C-terminal domain-containing protein [Microvirga massiliensis]|uniref:Mu transposase C-terminal domain-containing protein n=1 Tax=Microvirga massiliensis TaxID=1033741 RepID=UPI00062BD42B|nr:Mu transposase C-terminal domain-containing protein [Microvirga massiliensis]
MTKKSSAQLAAPLPPPSVPHFRLDPHDKVTIKGIDYVPVSSDEFAHVLRRLDTPDLCESFTHEEIDAYRQVPGKWGHVRGFFLSTKAKLRATCRESRIGDLPAKQQVKILWGKSICDGFLRMEDKGLATRSDASMKAAIKTITTGLLEAEMANGRCGSADIQVKWPPSPRTLRRWLRRYEACGYDAMALRDGYGRSGDRTPRFESEERALMREYAERYASRRKPTKRSLLQDLHARIDEENRERAKAGRRLLQKPSRAAFERVIDDLDPFHVYAGREGEAAARKKFYIVRGGLDVTRPLERVEMDEWNVQLQMLLMDAGLWSRLTPEQRAEVERRRLWLSTAIDCATRCFLAARLVENPCASTSVATLAMAVNDKSAYAEAAGCLTPWDMLGTPETVCTDTGSSYISHEHRAAVTDLGSEALFPPAGLPQMRGTKERSYRTLHKGLVARFDGRTFENVVVKGDYDAEAHAVLDVAELGRMIVRWIVDVYHNTPHAGLGGETPRNAWLRLSKIFPVIPPPDADTSRHIFGVTVERRIGNPGVRVLGLHYQSSELQRLRRDVRLKPVLVRIDHADLGHVSVRTPDGWLTVPCQRDGFAGVSVQRWTEATRALRRANADMAKLSEPIVLQALRDIQGFSEAATARAGIAAPILTSADCDRLDRDLFRTFDFDRGAEDGPEVLELPAPDGESIEGEAGPAEIPDDPAAGMPSDGTDGDDFFTED